LHKRGTTSSPEEVSISHYFGCLMAAGRGCLAYSRFAAPRPSLFFVLFLDKTGDYRVSMKKRIINDLKNKLKAIEVSNTALYCAFKCVQRVIPAGVFISCDFGN
jgi:hypothetical protein